MSFKESSPDEDVAQDSKDVLIDRLNDLVLRISDERYMEDGAVAAIHKEVDQIEGLMREKSPKAVRSGSQNSSVRHLGVGGKDDEVFWGTPSPTRTSRRRLPESWTKAQANTASQPSDMTTSRATELTTAVDTLATQLSNALSEIKARKEESNHIHDLLVVRCEHAASRILSLEEHISQVEEDYEACQSELKFLRLQLRAMEVQCLRHVPPDEDEELTESIRNWKVDWEDIDRRTKARRKKARIPRPELSTEDSWCTVDD
ncbi:hypothetical protein BP5796_11070 [Coleophoma crateriformis]|uniref:Uncharacterized protein n=1 Tax=Coleophoma crateriformis TaxID=565419 RepID=A0A3D8QM47_9HELO|nr:hypothetical protein BP5796_11070 [Coleophoma crateriformis]